MRAEMEDTAKNREDRAREGIARAGVANAFASHAVLLVGKSEVHGSGGMEGVDGRSSGREVEGAVVEGDVLEAKGGTASVGVRRKGVFTWTTQKEEAKQGNVAHRLCPGGDGMLM
jgi:hypothetical protein